MPSAAALIRAASRTISQADAEFLLTVLLRRRRHELYLGAGPVPDKTVREFLRLVERAGQGEPVQYLVRSAPFLDFDLFVDERVMIPRPETEELVTRTLARAGGVHRALDYGTGSGCIAIAVARLRPEARVIAADTSLPALDVARRNARELGVDRRIRFLRVESPGDPALAAEAGFDLIVSNPPYVPYGRIPDLDRTVRDHEPHISLDGGPEGTKILAMLLEQGIGLLRPDGLLALEIDETQADRLRRLAPAAVVETDLAGRDRYLFLRRGPEA